MRRWFRTQNSVTCIVVLCLSGNLSRAAPTSIVTIQTLSFEQAVAGIDQQLVTPANDSKAAVFQVLGDPLAPVTISVVDRFVDIYNVTGKNKKVRVSDFTLGGSVDNAGRGYLDQNGTLDNVRVGGAVRVLNSSTPGIYEGQVTLRVVYQ